MANLKSTFQNIAAAQYKERPLVNYIWINEYKVDPYPGAPTCGMPLQYIERAVQNANLYPQADFKLWIDKKLLDTPTIFWLGSFVYAKKEHENIEICDLQQIDSYASNEIFAGRGDIYIRADYARIIVLDHCMKNEEKRQHIIYSDIDCPDIRLKKVIQKINRHGIAVNDMASEIVSHGYIGLSNTSEAVKEHFPKLVEETGAGADIGVLGYPYFHNFLKRIGKPYPEERNSIAIKGLLPCCGYRVSAHEGMMKLGIN